MNGLPLSICALLADMVLMAEFPRAAGPAADCNDPEPGSGAPINDDAVLPDREQQNAFQWQLRSGAG
jgi:hypothetical protein